MVVFGRLLLVVALAIIAAGCAAYGPATQPEAPNSSAEEKMVVAAYLFDARVWRQGRPTSFRLEIYETDTVLAVAGRGYLGKGALKGWVRADSVKIFFPSTDEYVYDAAPNLFRSSRCRPDFSGLNILRFFSALPDTVNSPSDLIVTAVSRDSRHREYTAKLAGCPWTIDMTYDLQGSEWRVEKFEYSSGDGDILRAERREYKPLAKVSVRKFKLVIPPGSRQISS